MKNKSLCISLVILAALVASARWASRADNTPVEPLVQAADSTLAAALSLEDMVNQSDVIAIGSCLETESVWVDRSLVTLAKVAVNETLKGDETTTNLTVALPGGVDANRKFPIAMNYPGAPRLTPGEDVVLFLNNASEVAGSYTVAGFSQGKFSIVKDEDGELMVSRDLTKTSLQSNNGVRRGGVSNLTPLSSLKAEVKRQLQKQ
jgi:hypothetical protein